MNSMGYQSGGFNKKKLSAIVKNLFYGWIFQQDDYPKHAPNTTQNGTVTSGSSFRHGSYSSPLTWTPLKPSEVSWSEDVTGEGPRILEKLDRFCIKKRSQVSSSVFTSSMIGNSKLFCWLSEVAITDMVLYSSIQTHTQALCIRITLE